MVEKTCGRCGQPHTVEIEGTCVWCWKEQRDEIANLLVEAGEAYDSERSGLVRMQPAYVSAVIYEGAEDRCHTCGRKTECACHPPPRASQVVS